MSSEIVSFLKTTEPLLF